MIVVSGLININAAKADRAVELTGALVAETRKEAGNLTYEYWQDPADAGRWRVFEEWDNEQALNDHLGSPHMATFMTDAAELEISSVDISRYDVSAKSKLM